MEVTLYSKDGGSYVVTVEADDTVRSLKMRMLEGMARAPYGCTMALQLRGSTEFLDETALVSSTAIEAGDSIDLVQTEVVVKPGTMSREGSFASLSPCDRYVAISDAYTIKIYDTDSHHVLSEFQTHFPAQTHRFSPCSSLLLCLFEEDGGARVFNHLGESQQSWSLQSACTTAWNHEGNVLIYTHASRYLQVFSMAAGFRRELCCGSLLAVSQKEDVMYVGGDNTADLEKKSQVTGVLQHRFRGHSDAIVGCSLSRDESVLLTIGKRREARVWCAVNGTCLRVLDRALAGHVAVCPPMTVVGRYIPSEGSINITAAYAFTRQGNEVLVKTEVGVGFVPRETSSAFLFDE